MIVHNKPQAVPVAVSASPSTAAEAHKETVRRFFEFFAAGQVPAALALFHDDATYWFPTTRKTLTMPEFAEGLDWIRSRLDGPIAFELGPMVADGHAVAVQLESFAKTVDGAPFNNLYHVYFEFEGDRIARARGLSLDEHGAYEDRARPPFALSGPPRRVPRARCGLHRDAAWAERLALSVPRERLGTRRDCPPDRRPRRTGGIPLVECERVAREGNDSRPGSPPLKVGSGFGGCHINATGGDFRP